MKTGVRLCLSIASETNAPPAITAPPSSGVKRSNCQAGFLPAFGIEILRRQPGLIACFGKAPVSVGHGEPGRIVVLSLGDHMLAKDAFEDEAKSFGGTPGRFIAIVAFPFETSIAQ